MFLVTTQGKIGGVSVALATAADALSKLEQFGADGLDAIVFDKSGRVISEEDLRSIVEGETIIASGTT